MQCCRWVNRLLRRWGRVVLWILGSPNRIGQVADDERSLKYRGLERMSFLCRASSFWLSRLSMAGVGIFPDFGICPCVLEVLESCCCCWSLSTMTVPFPLSAWRMWMDVLVRSCLMAVRSSLVVLGLGGVAVARA